MSNMLPLHGFGGGVPLNFKVLAYATEKDRMAATPAENTIGVITDTKITSWILSPSEPAKLGEGVLWITTAASSPVEFNALKKNGIQIYPVSAQQFISGAWVDVPAKSYQDGEWVEWWAWDESTLFADGDEATQITGGWASHAYKVVSAYTGVNTAAISNNGDHLLVTFDMTATKQSTLIGPNNFIDLTDYNTLEINVGTVSGFSDSSGGIMGLRVYDQAGASVAETSNTYDAGTKTLDISSLSGKYRVGLLIWAAAQLTLTLSIEHAKIIK